MVQNREIEKIPLIIPAYEPDDRLLVLLEELQKKNIDKIVIVDDGSGADYRDIFEEAENAYHCIVLKHAVNQGKGRALKTAFNFCLAAFPEMIGCVTADSDGQHRPDCIEKCMEELSENPGNLILGCRDFDVEGIPFKSIFGNKLTRVVMKFFCGMAISDTQTGLRGIPTEFMKELLGIPGERFEFETRMLLAAKKSYPLVEFSIATIYDSKENHSTHFDPFKDSLKIYKILAGVFLKFIFSSFSASILDLVLFTLFLRVFQYGFGSYYIIFATLAARIISAFYNFLINYKAVFQSSVNYKKAGIRYAVLAVCQASVSALLVTGVCMWLVNANETFVKVIVDSCLFFVSFCIQRKYVYET